MPASAARCACHPHLKTYVPQTHATDIPYLSNWPTTEPKQGQRAQRHNTVQHVMLSNPSLQPQLAVEGAAWSRTCVGGGDQAQPHRIASRTHKPPVHMSE